MEGRSRLARGPGDRTRLNGKGSSQSKNADDATEILKLQPGEEHELRLPGKGTVGYAWAAEIEGDPGVVDVVITGAPAAEIADKAPGASVDELATVRARTAGTVTVRLVQRRSWDASRVLDRRDVRVEVRSSDP